MSDDDAHAALHSTDSGDSDDTDFWGFSDSEHEEIASDNDGAPSELFPALAPPPDQGIFDSYNNLFAATQAFAVQQGYAVCIKRSRVKAGRKTVVLYCDRGRRYKRSNTRRDSTSRMTECPFEVVARQKDGYWLLKVINAAHNYSGFLSGITHPVLRERTLELRKRIITLSQCGTKPREVMSIMQREFPD